MIWRGEGMSTTQDLVYVGFWPRVGAALIDGVLTSLIVFPIMLAVYGREYFGSTALVRGPVDFLFSWVLPAFATILFWVFKQATPGKMAIGARIVDAVTGEKPTTGKLVGRYFGYYLSTIVLLLGYIWVAFDPRKQGWHDKLAGTVVVRRPRESPEPVRFQGAPPH